MQALASGGGFAPRPTELDFVNAAIGALPPGSPPAVVETTRRHAQEQFGVITKSMDRAADAAVLNVQRWIAANPGALTIDKVPPQMVDAVRQLAPAKLDDLMRYARAVNNPDVSTNLTVYNRLAANPELLRRLARQRVRDAARPTVARGLQALQQRARGWSTLLARTIPATRTPRRSTPR